MPTSLLAFRETVLMCADKVVSKEKLTLRYLNCLTLCKVVSLPSRDEGGGSSFSWEQSITTFQGVEEQKVLVNPSTSGVYILLQSICNPLESEQSYTVIAYKGVYLLPLVWTKLVYSHWHCTASGVYVFLTTLILYTKCRKNSSLLDFRAWKWCDMF